MQFKLSTLLALALASTSLALPDPTLPKRWANEPSCTKPQGSICHGGCYHLKPTEFIKACADVGIDVKSSVGVKAILKGAGAGHATEANVDIDLSAVAKVDASLSAKWPEICEKASVPADQQDKISLIGKIDLKADIGVDIMGLVSGIFGGSSSECGHCQ